MPRRSHADPAHVPTYVPTHVPAHAAAAPAFRVLLAPLALALLLVALPLAAACSDSSASSPPQPPAPADDAATDPDATAPAPDTEPNDASPLEDTVDPSPDSASPPDTASTPDADPAPDDTADAGPVREPVPLRVATYNTSLFRDAEGALRTDLASGDDAHAASIARVLQELRPDVVLLNEFDWDADAEAARLFHDLYLAVPQADGLEPLAYPHRWAPPTNTGESTGVDVNNDGQAVTEPGSRAYGDDCHGFGTFPGQYGMVVLSRFPLRVDQARSFRLLRWRDLPGHRMPLDWYREDAADLLRLSSKNHVDLPVDVEGRTLHLLLSHPTPPSFDGPERRNRLRNHDEIRLWVHYLTHDGEALTDDDGAVGNLPADAPFVVLGDLNSDPNDGSGLREGIRALLDHPRVNDTRPASLGAPESDEREGLANWEHRGDPALDTANFAAGSVGNLRVDYCLPSTDLEVLDSGVFWPLRDDALHAHTSVSDHHPVWVDLRF